MYHQRADSPFAMLLVELTPQPRAPQPPAAEVPGPRPLLHRLGPLRLPSSPQDISQHGMSSSMNTLLPSRMHADRYKQLGSRCASQLAEIPRPLHKMINWIFRRWLRLAGRDAVRGTGFNGKEVELLLSPAQLLSGWRMARGAAEFTPRTPGAPRDSGWSRA